MHLKGFVPILLIVPVAIVSLFSIAIIATKGHQLQVPRPFALASPAQLSQPSPEPSPVASAPATSEPSAKISPTPAPSPSLEYSAHAQAAPPSPSPVPKPVSSSGSSSTTSGGNYTVATFNLGSVTVVTDSANDDDCSNNCPTKPLAQFISENGGHAGINGTYFCPPDYSWCSGKVNTYDFPVWNNRKKKWMEASKLFWDGRGMMLFRGGSAQFYPCAKCSDAASNITGGIVNYPSLLANGQVLVGDGGKGSRGGIGFGNGKLFLVVARNASYLDLANIFKSLGATDALNLDGGGSTALYDGGYKAGPGRALPNAIIIK